MTMPDTYRMPARSVGIGAVIRRRTPAGALIDHVIDRIELRAGDEVRIDVVDPATGWGAFLVLDGSAEVDVVGPDPEADDDDHDPVTDLVQSTIDDLGTWGMTDPGAGIAAHHRPGPSLMTEPHDGHEPGVTCPGCPHPEEEYNPS